jgi:hypothetical protein
VLPRSLVVLSGFGEFGDVAIAQIEIVLLGSGRVGGRREDEQAEQGKRSHSMSADWSKSPTFVPVLGG